MKKSNLSNPDFKKSFVLI